MVVLCLLVDCYISTFVEIIVVFFFQAEDGIRDLVRSRGLRDVYKRQNLPSPGFWASISAAISTIQATPKESRNPVKIMGRAPGSTCLLYTSDAADERSSVDLGGRRIIKKKKNKHNPGTSDLTA